MGWYDAKYMLMIMLVLCFITNIYSQEIPQIQGTNVQIVSNKYISSFVGTSNFNPNATYSVNNSLQYGDVGNQSTFWVTHEEEPQGILDKLLGLLDVFAWFTLRIGNAIKSLYGFVYAPFHLLNAFIMLDNLTILWWLPTMFGAIWTFLWIYTLISIFTGR